MEKTGTRLLRRRNLFYYLAVHDGESGQLLGHLADITSEGVKLISRDPIETNQLFRLRLELPEQLAGLQELRFEARSRWTGRDVNPEFFVTGFVVEQVGDRDRKAVAALINLYGFKD